MPRDDDPADPHARLDLDPLVLLERFAWHPEPELIGIRDAAVSRPALERLGAAAWSTALDYLFDEALRRAMGEPTGYPDLRRRFFGPGGEPGPAPSLPTPSEELLDEFARRLAPHMLNAWHPRTLSYFTPPPLVASIVGELLAQWTNQGIDVWHAGPVGAFVEEEVIRWLCDLVGYGAPGRGEAAGPPAGGAEPGRTGGAEPGRMGGAEASQPFGLLTSGGVMANFLAMALVRDVHLARVRGATRPPRGEALEDARVYTSDQAHFSIARALDELGFPPDTLVGLPSDDRFRLRAEPVAEAIRRDRSAGLKPVAIAAVAGSTNTGSVDLVGELADLAAREGLWLHVDAAYGGAARLSPRIAPLVPDLGRADSVTIDPHKWFFQAYDIGALLVRRRRDLLDTFHRLPEYYRGATHHAGAEAPHAGSETPHVGAEAPHAHEPLNFYQYGMEGTRRWRALKLWLSWKHLGSEGFGRLIEANVDLARYLARRCAEADDFDALPAEPDLSVVCFRHLPGGRGAGLARGADGGRGTDWGAGDAGTDRGADGGTATGGAGDAGAGGASAGHGGGASGMGLSSGAGLAGEALDRHQERLQAALEASGEGWLSTTTLRGRTYLRAGIVNYLATEADVDRLLDELRRLAANLEP